MNVEEATVLVTGTNRGIGRCLVDALYDGGAKKIYAGARDVAKLGDLATKDPDRIEAVTLDITNADQVAGAAVACGDITLLINNAGINFNRPLIGAASVDNARAEVETNYIGTLTMCRAFAPVLAANGGGMIVNILSILARVSIPAIGSLCASKAASWLMTQGVRAELAAQGTHVMAVLPGSVDTDMTPGGESKPEDIAAQVLQAIRDDAEDLYPGDMAQGVSAGLAKDRKAVEKEFAAYLPQ